jgi:hypothetical protein
MSKDTPQRLVYLAILKLFAKHGWLYKEIPAKDSAAINFQGENGAWLCLAQAREEASQFVFYSVCPIEVPMARRYPVVELVTMVNATVILGNFMMDFADGELKYKTMSCLEKGRAPSVELLERLVFGNLTVMDQFLPAIESVVGLDTSPLIAFHEIVGDGT